MKKIFLNDPKIPKGLRFYLRVIAIILLLAVQFGLVYALFDRFSTKHRESEESIVAPVATPAPYVAPTNPQPLSVKDKEMREILDDYFGPLPRPAKNPPRRNKLYPVKGIYLGKGFNLENSLALAEWSEVNAFVIDVKESWGLTYQSNVPLAKEINASQGDANLKDIIDKCHEKGVKVIARIVCFKDNILTSQRPDMCITDKDGNLLFYPLEGGLAFANPYDTRVWEYLIEIAKEVVAMGADEIQFDYVRFPSGQPDSEAEPIYVDIQESIGKDHAVNRFLETARIEIQENLGVPITADLFSIIMTSQVDGLSIGQNWDTIGLTGIDAICPMIYPSHYANASFGSQGNQVGSYIGKAFFERPDLEPYAVVQNAMYDGEKASLQKGYSMLRPWLQAFTADWLSPGFYMQYGPAEIRTQIDALYDLGYGEWILWNADYAYPDEAFITKEEAEEEEKRQVIESLEQQSERASKAEAQEQEESRRFPIVTAPADEE